MTVRTHDASARFTPRRLAWSLAALATGWLALAVGGAADAADMTAPASRIDLAGGAPAAAVPRILSEVRLGGSVQDAWSPEKGAGNITAAVLFERLPFAAASDPALAVLVPRPVIGGSLDLGGRTSFAYAALAWTVPVGQHFFIEASFGGAVHNGDTSDHGRATRNALGCSPLFRESFAVGYRFDERLSLLAMVEHLSNAGLCDANRGLTNLGLQLAYSF